MSRECLADLVGLGNRVLQAAITVLLAFAIIKIRYGHEAGLRAIVGLIARYDSWPTPIVVIQLGLWFLEVFLSLLILYGLRDGR